MRCCMISSTVREIVARRQVKRSQRMTTHQKIRKKKWRKTSSCATFTCYLESFRVRKSMSEDGRRHTTEQETAAEQVAKERKKKVSKTIFMTFKSTFHCSAVVIQSLLFADSQGAMENFPITGETSSSCTECSEMEGNEKLKSLTCV